MVPVAAGLALAPPADLVYEMLEGLLLALDPPLSPRLVLRPSLDLGVGVYPKLGICLQARMHHPWLRQPASEPFWKNSPLVGELQALSNSVKQFSKSAMKANLIRKMTRTDL